MAAFEFEADWVGSAMGPGEDTGFYVFRKFVTLDKGEQEGFLWVSADQRYRIYVNGSFVGFGPQVDERKHWRRDRWEVGEFLQEGQNVVACVVANFGYQAAFWQETERTAFVCDGLLGKERVNTGKTRWEVAKLSNLEFGRYGNDPYWMTHRVSPGERLVGGHFDWATVGDGLFYVEANFIENAMTGLDLWATGRWFLRERTIPALRYDTFEGEVRRVLKDGFRVPLEAVEVPAGETVLLDTGELLTAFPLVTLSGEQGAEVRVLYQEALVDAEGAKGNRNETVGKSIVGYGDKLVLGREKTTFETFMWRTFRYVELKSDKPFRLEGFGAMVTGYPIEVEGKFESDIPDTGEIWTTAIRTARRCARDTYMDCPYYEELQYAGDTRIQAMVGYFLSRDRRLQRNAVDQLVRSDMGEGIISSRAPSREKQTIMPFHYWTMLMITDLALHDPEAEWGSGKRLTAMWDRMWQGAEEWMTGWRKEIEDGSWFFGDWVDGWQTGVPPGGRAHPMHVLTRQVVWDARRALEGKSGPQDLPELTGDLVRDKAGLLVGLKGNKLVKPSEHGEALARYRSWLFGKSGEAWPTAGSLMDKTTLYFSYYRHLVDHSVDYSGQLEPWREMLRQGLTTFPEKGEPTRSDCHAWSAHPILGFFQRVAGVRSLGVGWSKVLVAPCFEDCEKFEAVVPHPAGDLVVSRSGDGLSVETPVPGRVVWRGKTSEVRAGRHRF